MGARLCAGLFAGICALIAVAERFAAAEAGTLRAGNFSFSDELGGFTILGVTGTGSTEDPIVIHERLEGPGEATLVIRRHHVPTAYAFVGDTIRVCIRKVIVNATGRPWEGFDLELQEERGRPSVHGDGLSFDQLARFEDVRLAADRFSEIQWKAEPYDRILLRKGTVDVGEVLIVDFAVTDVTPKPLFFLRQDPILLMAGGVPLGPAGIVPALPADRPPVEPQLSRRAATSPTQMRMP